MSNSLYNQIDPITKELLDSLVVDLFEHNRKKHELVMYPITNISITNLKILFSMKSTWPSLGENGGWCTAIGYEYQIFDQSISLDQSECDTMVRIGSLIATTDYDQLGLVNRPRLVMIYPSSAEASYFIDSLKLALL